MNQQLSADQNAFVLHKSENAWRSKSYCKNLDFSHPEEISFDWKFIVRLCSIRTHLSSLYKRPECPSVFICQKVLRIGTNGFCWVSTTPRCRLAFLLVCIVGCYTNKVKLLRSPIQINDSNPFQETNVEEQDEEVEFLVITSVLMPLIKISSEATKNVTKIFLFQYLQRK